jgi:hypothetical protein
MFTNKVLANLSLRDQMLATRYKYNCTVDTPEVVGLNGLNPSVRIDAATLLSTFNYNQYRPSNPHFVPECLR